MLALAISCFALVACGGGSSDNSNATTPSADSQYIGTWEASSAEFQGEAQDVKEALDGKTITLELNGDGTASVLSDEDTTKANWYETSEGVKIKGDDIDMELKSTDGKLSFNLLGVTIFFEKK